MGGLYALIALGFVIIYKATRVINFAIGEIMMFAAYLFLAFAGGMELSPNVVTNQTLRAAQQHPDQYRDLIVRVDHLHHQGPRLAARQRLDHDGVGAGVHLRSPVGAGHLRGEVEQLVEEAATVFPNVCADFPPNSEPQADR